MKKKWGAAAVLALALILAACAPQGDQPQFGPGDKVSTYWFNFTVQWVETADSYEGYAAAQGNRLVLCRLEIQNTFSKSVPMGQGDFILMWEDPEGAASQQKGAFPLARYTDAQLPDEYDMEVKERWEGLLIFEVPAEVRQAGLMFEEQYVDGESESDYAVGDRYTVEFNME